MFEREIEQDGTPCAAAELYRHRNARDDLQARSAVDRKSEAGVDDKIRAAGTCSVVPDFLSCQVHYFDEGIEPGAGKPHQGCAGVGIQCRGRVAGLRFRLGRGSEPGIQMSYEVISQFYAHRQIKLDSGAAAAGTGLVSAGR